MTSLTRIDPEVAEALNKELHRQQNNIELIVMGMNYKKRFGSFTMGNAVPHVLEEAPCRVLICREPKT